MSNDTPIGQQNNVSPESQLVFTIDGHQLSLAPVFLTETDVREDIRQQCLSAQIVHLQWWETVVYLPQEIQQFLLGLIEECTGRWHFHVSGVSSPFSDVFAATLAVQVPQNNLQLIERATTIAQAAAAMVCPGASSEAARQIQLWLSQYGVTSEPIRTLARSIRDQGSECAQSDKVTPQDAARLVLARLQTDRMARGESEPTCPPVRYYKGDYYLWVGSSWQPDPTFECLVVQILQQQASHNDLTSTFITSVCRNIQGLTLFSPPSDVSFPVYVESEHPLQVNERQIVSFYNGQVDLAGLHNERTQPALCNHDPLVFCAPFLNYEYSPGTQCPLWLQTIQGILPEQGENDRRQSIVQEFFAYCFMPWFHRLEKFVIMIGDGANGKSVLLTVLRAMLGSQNVSNVPLDALASQFRLGDMIGKLANVATDMQRMQKVHEGTLKQLVSGEPLQIDRKHRDPGTRVPTAKLIFATNHLPPVGDTSDGLWRRMIVIPFNQRFDTENCDVHRAHRIIETELPGVLNWAMAGARRLISRQQFSLCSICDAAKHDHHHDSDPLLQFLDECCELGPERQVVVDEFYNVYRGYCEANGKCPKAKSEIGKLIKGFGITRDRERQSSRRCYVYHGLDLRQTVVTWGGQNPRIRQYQPGYPQHLAPRPIGPHSPNNNQASPEEPDPDLNIPTREVNPGT